MSNWIKRLLMLMLLLTAILMLAAPGALADPKDMSDFDESDWEDYWGGFFAICSECDKWEAEGTCMICCMCTECMEDDPKHCKECGYCEYEEDEKCVECELFPCCVTFEVIEAAGYEDSRICDDCIGDYDFSFCFDCGEAFEGTGEWSYCTECFHCMDCWEIDDHCRACGEEKETCSDCDEKFCMDCHAEFGLFCPQCGTTCIAADDTLLCGGEDNHCVENCCNWEWVCAVCEGCFYEDQSDYCQECNHCISCGIDEYRHCAACAACYDGSTSACGDHTYCIDCCPDESGEHCSECGLHINDETDDWCGFGGEGTHCQSCMDYYCEECEACFECEGEEECSDCGLCVKCCEEKSQDEGCACGMCVENGDFEAHLSCPDCGLNMCEEGVEFCEYCELCPECCLAYSEDAGCACGMCVEESGFEEHAYCPDCDYSLCENGEELCNTCDLCPECCLANSEAEGCACEMCVEDSDFEAHLLCPDCGYNLCENGDELCMTCDLCPVCCENNSIDEGCICGMCVGEVGFAKHVTCKGCDEGLCASGYPPCEYCGMCVNCCEELQCVHGVCHADRAEMRAHTCPLCGDCYSLSELCATCSDNGEIICRSCCASETAVIGCSHGICVNDAEAWLAHWCWECSECVSECPHDTPQGEHPVTPKLSYTYDEELHWRECRYCSEFSHYTGRAAHNFAYGTCRFCEKTEVTNNRLYSVKQPKDMIVTQPNPGEEDITVTLTAVFGNASDAEIRWQKEWIRQEEVGGEIIEHSEWDWFDDIDMSYTEDEKGNLVVTGSVKITSESCLQLDRKGVFARYRLYKKDDEGRISYTYPISIRVQHNALTYKYLTEDMKGYGAKKNRYSGMHWPACSICGEGDVFAEAEVHTGEWKLKEGTKSLYCRNCDVCGAYEEWYGSDLLINGHPQNETIELLHDPEPGVVKTAVFSIPDCTVTPSGITGDDYTWEFSLDGVKWYTAFDKRAEELKCGFTFGGTFSKELKVYTTTETPCNGAKYYFRCKVGGLHTNYATLRIKCNQEGYSYYNQKKNNAIGAQGQEIYMNKHWPACTGCGKNEDRELAEDHVFGGTLHDAEKDLDYKVCATCGYEEWEYADDEFHFEINPVSMTIENARPGDIVQLKAKATGTDKEIYYQWIECEPIQVDTINNTWGIQSWDIVDEGYGRTTFSYEVSEADCDYSQRSGYHRAFICFAKAGEPINPYEHGWAKDVIATNYVKLTFEHNQDGYNYDDLYHWPACSHCGKNENLDAFQPHEIGQWQAVETADDGSVTFERSCICGYTETTRTLYTDVYAYVSNIMRPAPGVMPDFNASIQTSSGTRENEVKWYKLNENGEKSIKPMGDQDVFEENTAYRVEVTLRAKSGYGYSLNEGYALINGENANWYYPADGVGVVTLYTDYNTGDCITYADIYDIIQPIADTSIDYTAEIGSYDYSIEPVNGNDVAWYYMYPGSEKYVSWPKEWTINADYSYRAEVVLLAEEGKYFAIDQNGNSVVNAKINGKSAKVIVDDSMTYGNVRYVKVSYDFGKPQMKNKGILITGHEVSNGQWLGNNGRVYNGTPSGNGWAWYKDGKLTLNNFSGTAESGVRGIVIYRPLTIELIGKNSLTVENYASGINVAGNLVIEGSGSLTLNAGKAGINVNEGSLIMNGGTVIVNAGNEALYIGNHYDSSKTLILNDGYLKLVSKKYEGLYMLSWMDGNRTPIHVNGGTMVMSGPNYATNVWALEGLATVVAGTSDSDAVVLDDIGMMSTYPYVKITHDKQDAYYVVAQPVDTTFICGPEATGAVEFVLSNEADKYTWYLIDGGKTYTAEELAMNSVISASGWDMPSLKLDAGITTVQAYCVAETEMETFTSDTVTLTMEHVFGSYTSRTGDDANHYAYCDRCWENYQHPHVPVYNVTDKTSTASGMYNFKCALCGHISANKFFDAPIRRGTLLLLNWNDGLGTTETKSISRYATTAIDVVPVREGHIFLGWAVLPNATEPDFTERIHAVDQFMTVYAVWKPYDYTISGWVTSNGTAENPVTVKVDLYKVENGSETFYESVEVVNDDASMAERYTFEMLWPGNYRIKATAEDYEDFEAEMTVVNYSVTQDIFMERPEVSRMDFTVEKFAAGNHFAGVKVTTDTPGVIVNDSYGENGCMIYSDNDGYMGNAITSGKIRGGNYYWLRVGYSIDDEFPFDWYNNASILNGYINCNPGASNASVYATFRVYVPENGEEATGYADITAYNTPDAYGRAEQYPYFALYTNMDCVLVDQKYMKDGEWFSGEYEEGETYTMRVSVRMDDPASMKNAMFTINGKPADRRSAEGDVIVMENDYRINKLLTFTLPEMLTAIDDEAFAETSAGRFILPESCVYIGTSVFAGSDTVKAIVIPAKNITISKGAFAGCGLTTIICAEDSDAYEFAMNYGYNWKPIA